MVASCGPNPFFLMWYSAIGDQPCPDMKMWKVSPDLSPLGHPVLDIIHLDTILHNAHLMGICDGSTQLPIILDFMVV